MAPTRRLLAGYLLLALVPLLGTGATPFRLLLAMAHVCIAFTLLRPLPAPEPMRARWLPLLLVPLLYAELPLLNQWIIQGMRDPVVLAWEATLFPCEPARTLAGRWPSTLLSEGLHLSYLSYYGIVFLPLLLLELRGRRKEFHRTALGLMVAFTFSFFLFWLFPVEGPRYRFPAPDGVPEGPVRALVLVVLEAGSSRGTAFPSSHASAAVAQTLLALRFQPGVGVVIGILTAGLCIGAVYGGFHYAVDMLAGVIIGTGAAIVALPRKAGVAGGSSPF